jgi:hypothetical protein
MFDFKGSTAAFEVSKTALVTKPCRKDRGDRARKL